MNVKKGADKKRIRPCNRGSSFYSPSPCEIFHKLLNGPRCPAMLKYFFLSYAFVAAIVVAAFGTRGSKSELPPIEIFPDMDHQAKVKYQVKNDFFADGVGARLPVKHTVPMGFDVPAKPASSLDAKPTSYGFTNGVDYYSTGKIGDFYGDGLPAELAADKSLIERGQRQYVHWQ
jgi:hypothetical protein